MKVSQQSAQGGNKPPSPDLLIIPGSALLGVSSSVQVHLSSTIDITDRLLDIVLCISDVKRALLSIQLCPGIALESLFVSVILL